MAGGLEEALALVRFPEVCEDETGDGCRIVIIDSGAGRGLPLTDYVNLTDSTILDTESHGSLIHSIISHILPEAEIYYVKVPDPLPDKVLITALSEALRFNPHAVNLSITSEVPSDGSDPVSLYVNHVSKRAVVAVAAGNGGPRLLSVGSPAVADRALTVGATNLSGRLWKRSSRGPTLDSRWKPNIVAPTGFTIAGEMHDLQALGTSFATPLATALAAVLMERLRNTYLTTKIMELTATPIPVSTPISPILVGLRKAAAVRRLLEAWPRLTDPRNLAGMGLMNAAHAVETAAHMLEALS